MYTVTVAMATGGTVRSETVTSLIGALDVIRANGVDYYLALEIGGYVARNRNDLVNTAQNNGSTHIMFIDNDQTFRPSAIQRLIDNDKDIVCAPYNARPAPGSPLVSVVKMMDENGELPMDGSHSEFNLPKGLVKVGGSGTGFMLIKTAVFEKLKKPYFVAWESPEGVHHTEDIEFCIRARKAGFDVWANTSIPIGHVGTSEF